MGEEIETKVSTETPKETFKEYFDKLCSYMLSIGMSYTQFWDEDPQIVNYYIEAEKIRQQKLNNQLWIQGVYFQLAVASCLDKRCKYPRSPIPLSKEEQEQARKQREEAFKQRLIAMSTK